MIRLILARHGNTFEKGETPTQVGARSDLPLTAEGRKQAEALAGCLTPHVVYAGSLRRQIETAMLFGKKHTLEPALTEIDYGLWEGLTTEEITDRWPEEYTQWTTKGIWQEGIFGGSLEEHQRKIANWLEFLRSTYKNGDTILGVTSNGIIRLFYPTTVENVEQLKVKTGHFCELNLLDNSVEVVSWNTKP